MRRRAFWRLGETTLMSIPVATEFEPDGPSRYRPTAWRTRFITSPAIEFARWAPCARTLST